VPSGIALQTRSTSRGDQRGKPSAGTSRVSSSPWTLLVSNPRALAYIGSGRFGATVARAGVRFLFLSGTSTGGSAVSTRQLAHRLAARGHEVDLLVQRRTRPRAGLVASPRGRRITLVTTAPGRVWRALRRAATTQPKSAGNREGVEEWTSVAPEQVLPSLCEAWRPDVVVVNSVHCRAWTAIRSWLRSAGIPVVLYVREVATFEHIPIAELRPDLIVTNSDAHRRRAAELDVQVYTIPSLIEFERCDVETTREVALFINPLPSRGLAVAVALARERPDVRFGFQLSWPLRRRDLRALRRWIRGQPNIELRACQSQSARVYRDARVLLLPYQVDQRPRVVAEAQWNGVSRGARSVCVLWRVPDRHFWDAAADSLRT